LYTISLINFNQLSSNLILNPEFSWWIWNCSFVIDSISYIISFIFPIIFSPFISLLLNSPSELILLSFAWKRVGKSFYLNLINSWEKNKIFCYCVFNRRPWDNLVFKERFSWKKLEKKLFYVCLKFKIISW